MESWTKAELNYVGATYSLFSFTRKVGQAIGAAAASSYAIALGGYTAAKVQPDSAVTAIKVAAGGVPAVVILVAISVMAAYPITEDRFRRMLREIAERRATRGFDETLLQDENAG